MYVEYDTDHRTESVFFDVTDDPASG